MHSYCLFCRTEKCGILARSIQQRFGCRAISPRIVQRIWVAGVETQQTRDYLPGYLFLYAEEPMEDFRAVRRMPGVLRVLGDESERYVLEGRDRQFARMLYDCGGVIGIQKAVQEGDRVKLAAGLNGYEAEIVRLERRRGRAQIRFLFENAEHYVWIGYDLIDRVIDDQPSPEAAPKEP